jgi:nicotinate phosphoribosyltransferase
VTTPPASPVPPALVTDLYELTMAAAYQAHGIDHEATFELFVRRLPDERRFLVAAGLDDALAGLEVWCFGEDDCAYLAGLGLFPPGFVERLAGLRFTGEVWAVPEGEAVFAGEPLVRVTAPVVEAQLVETWLLNRIASQTLLASKAARVALACGDRGFVDFSARRDHGVDAALAAARAAWMCGATGTSLVAAGRRWGIPLSGTMAHSFVMAHDDERDAFRAYARAFPDSAVLLVDTYDTVTGARRRPRWHRSSRGRASRSVRSASTRATSTGCPVRCGRSSTWPG